MPKRKPELVERLCPACRALVWFTVRRSGPWTIYTCRGGCGNTHRVCYR